MEVKAGYKMTEVGVIPEEWDAHGLETVCTDSGLVRGPFGGSLTKSMFVTTGYKVYEQRNAIYSSISIGQYYINRTKYNELSRFAVRPNDFIVSCSGTIGTIFQIPENAPEGVINQALLKITLNPLVIDDKYFFHVFSSGNFQERIKENTHGGAMQNLVGMPVFRKALIPLPPLAEQRAIAEALSDADAHIAALEALIAKKRAVKHGAMQDLLSGNRRLPGFRGEWQTICLSTACSIITKGTTPTSIGRKFTENGVAFIKAESIGLNGRPIPNKVAYIDWRTDSLLRRSKLMEGDILISIAGVLGRVGLIEKSDLPANINQALAIIRLAGSSMIDHDYLFHFLYGDQVQRQIREINVQAAQANISLQNVRDLLITYPATLAEQSAIAAVLSDMDNEIEVHEAKLTKARQIKTAMMQELLTGRTRLV